MLRHIETGKLLPLGVVPIQMINACRFQSMQMSSRTTCVEKGHYCTGCLARVAGISLNAADNAIKSGEF